LHLDNLKFRALQKISIASPSFAATYAPDDRRASKTAGGQTTYHVYDEDGSPSPLIEEQMSGGTASVSMGWGWGADGLRSRYFFDTSRESTQGSSTDDQVYFYTYDPQGSRMPTDFDYQLFVPPLSMDFQVMKPKQAQEYLDWFICQIPIRIEQLNNLTADLYKVNLNSTPASLLELDKWFSAQVEMRAKTEAELAEDKASLPSWLHADITDEIFTQRTFSICVDIAIYFAEVLRRQNLSLHWDFVRKPKIDADFHQPVLISLSGKMHLNPIRIVTVIALKTESGNRQEHELMDMFHWWDNILRT